MTHWINNDLSFWNTLMTDAALLIQKQLDTWNAKDVEGWLSTYASDAQQFNLHGELLAVGHEAMRARTIIRFAEPDLKAELLSRVVMGNIVVDHEKITRNFPEGRGSLEMLCVYEIKDGLIQKASFATHNQKLD